MEQHVTDQGSNPVAQEMARLVNEKLDSVVATQRLHGEVLGTILTRLDGHDARFDAIDARLDGIEEQMRTGFAGVMEVLGEMVGKKTT